MIILFSLLDLSQNRVCIYLLLMHKLTNSQTPHDSLLLAQKTLFLLVVVALLSGGPPMMKRKFNNFLLALAEVTKLEVEIHRNQDAKNLFIALPGQKTLNHIVDFVVVGGIYSTNYCARFM